MKRLSTIIFSFLFHLYLFGQGSTQRITLQQAIETAIANNIQVKQSNLLVESAEVNYRQARANQLPNLNGNVAHGMNQGRSIDPFTNAYLNQQINYASYGVGTNLVLFNGFSMQNTIKQNAYALDASRLEVQQVKENLTLNVILAYLQVLNNEDLVEASKIQVTVTQKQIDRLEVLNRQGAIPPPLLSDLRAQLKADELDVINSQNALEVSKLNLAQLMNTPYEREMQLERISMEELFVKPSVTQTDVFSKAMDRLSLVKAAQLRKQSADAAVRAIRGELYPTLLLNSNLNSNYSSAAARDVLINTTDVTTSNYVIVNGSQVPVMAKQRIFNTERIGYTTQLKNNVFSSIGVSLRLPIFNGFQTRNRIKQATIQVKTAELAEENTRILLRQQVEQAYLNATNAWERYKVLVEQVSAYAESFRAAEIRFNSGVGTSVDYLIAKNNLDRANISLVSAKYDYLLRNRILDFYMGR